MKSYIMYVCEICGFESKDDKEVEKCEREHYGLTEEEMKHYKKLKADSAHAGAVLYSTNNEKTRKEFNDAIENLIKFEKEHNIEV